MTARLQGVGVGFKGFGIHAQGFRVGEGSRFEGLGVQGGGFAH